jgi:chromate transporter
MATMELLHLFAAFLKVGFFAIGGAYSFLPLTEKEVVQSHHWLEKSEFLEVTGMVELFPGAISIKFATYVGYKVAGVPGAIVANIANLLPPVLCMILASLLYSRFAKEPWAKAGLTMVRYAVFAMIVAIALKLVDRSHLVDLKVLPVVIVAFLLMMLTKIHPALIIVGAAIYGGLFK